MTVFIIKGFSLGVAIGLPLFFLSSWIGAYRSALRSAE